MCGIFGIVSREREVSRELLARAQQCLAHRGPDSNGTFLRNEEDISVGFAHTRLSIIDLSPLGQQPMEDPATGNWIVYNGEIYNFRELRQELESAGAAFRSHSDTEVILAAYRMWGEKCFSRLAGMFALGLWDARQKRLLLARDPMGIKPLYCYRSEECFLFASELRTLLRTGLVPRKVEPMGVWSYLAFGSVYEPWTMVKGVSPVPPGHLLTVADGKINRHAYWSLQESFGARSASEENARKNGSSSLANLTPALRDAVLSHLVSDVPVGVFLSGGIDSSSLVAVLSHNGVRPSSFSLVFREEEFNEAQFSRAVARCFGTDHHEIPISLDDTLAALPDALRAMDLPTIDGINTYLISAKVRAEGLKVALTGLGGDELFAGYSNFRRVPRMESFVQSFGRLPRFARRSLSAAMTRLAGMSDRTRKLAELAADHEAMVHPYFLARALFGPADREALFASGNAEPAERALAHELQSAVDETQPLDPVNRVSYLETCFYMRNTLLRDSDFMSMAHGLELRVPFLDRNLVEACFRIPGNQKLGGDGPKPLLLASLGVELPLEIVKRPKRGFTLPFERWLRGEMKPILEDALRKTSGVCPLLKPDGTRDVWTRFLAGQTSWSRPWSLFVLQRWCEENL